MSWWRRLQAALPGRSEPPSAANQPDPVAPRVLLVIHDPVAAGENGRSLRQILGWNDPDALVAAYIADLRRASGGYLRYQIAERVVVDGFPVKADGFVYDAATYLYRWRSGTGFHVPDAVDYHRLLAQFKVAPKINLEQIDEVWLMAFPYAGYYESVMAGPGAFWCNAPPLQGIGRCRRRFVIMGFNYERGVGEMLESFGHRAESIMSHVYRHRQGDADLWARFIRHEKTHPGRAECGTIHYAPNSERDYDWGNRRWVRSFCHNWLHFPDLSGPPRRVNCREWGGGEIRAHHLWWLRHLPHVGGQTGGVTNNWWQYIVDPNQVT
jgi:hypothetical protein